MSGSAPRSGDIEPGSASSEQLPISSILAADAPDRKDYLISPSQAAGLFQYAQHQRDLRNPPWIPEYGILHRLNIADINNQLACCKKEIYEVGAATNEQMEKLRRLLNEQCMYVHCSNVEKNPCG
jgi:hypothetical protein